MAKSSPQVKADAKNTSLYVRGDSSGKFICAIAYVVNPKEDGSSYIHGAYYGFVGGGEYDGGFFFIDAVNDEFAVLDYDSIEEREEKNVFNQLMSLCGQYCRDDDPSQLTEKASALLSEIGEETDGEEMVYMTSDFDGDSLSEVSEIWPLFIKFQS